MLQHQFGLPKMRTGYQMKMQVEVFIIVSKTLGEVQKSINKYIGMGWQTTGDSNTSRKRRDHELHSNDG